MPITIKSTELKYKNPSTGQYQGIDAVAERTTSEQCALIEAKGAETIASIPSDYTTLANDVSDLNGAITHDTMHDTHTPITTDPASLDAIKNYDIGIYRVVIPNTTVFPTDYGILEILKGEQYSMARFSNVNSSEPAVWRVQWCTSSGEWYQGGVWLDEQKYVKENKISKSGDIYTGALIHHTDQYTSGTAPTDKTKFAPFFQLADSSNNNLVFFQGTSYVNGDEGFEITTRRNNNGTWVYNTLRLLLDSSFNSVVYLSSPGAWRTTLGLSYAKGDTESFTASCLCAVLVTNNSKNIYFDFDLPKSLENISTVSVTTMNGAFRGADGGATTGYIDYWGNRNWVSVSGYTPSVTKLGSHRIRIALAKTTQYHYITDDHQTVGNVVPTNSMSTYWGTLSFSFS